MDKAKNIQNAFEAVKNDLKIKTIYNRMVNILSSQEGRAIITDGTVIFTDSEKNSTAKTTTIITRLIAKVVEREEQILSSFGLKKCRPE